jgi:hypothetical protein
MEPVSSVECSPDRTTLTAVGVLFLGALPLGLTNPWLAPVLLVPVAALVWVLRARVTADQQHLEVCNGLGVRRISWTDVDRLDLPKRGPVVLHETTGRATRLTALPRRSVGALVGVSQPEPAAP